MKKISDDQLPLFVVEDMGAHTPLLAGTSDLKLLGNYHLVTSIAQLETLALQLRTADRRAFDTEFTTPKGTLTSDKQIKVSPHHPNGIMIGISVAALHGTSIQAWYIPTGHRGAGNVPVPEIRRVLGPLFERLEWSGHPVKVDSHVLFYHGIITQPVPIGIDTLVAAGLIGFREKGLKDLAVSELGWETIEIKEVVDVFIQPRRDGKRPPLRSDMLTAVDPERMMRYAAHDAAQTVALADHLAGQLQSMWTLYTRIVRPVSSILETMERAGILVDVDYFTWLDGDLAERQAPIEDELRRRHPTIALTDTGFREVLYTTLGLPVLEETEHGEPSIDAAALMELAEAIADDPERMASIETLNLIKRWKVAKTIRSTFILSKFALRPYLKDPTKAYVYTTYNQHVARTGRLSSSDPVNGQNIPVRTGPEVRRGVVCEADECILVIDQSQMEPRCMAYYLAQAGDETLRKAFRDGVDYYVTLGSFALGVLIDPKTKLGVLQRKSSKVFALAGAYGASAPGLVYRPELKFLDPTVEKMQLWLSNLFEKVPGIRRYHLSQVWRAIRDGYVQSGMGRRRPIPNITSPDQRLRSKARRDAINMPIQALNADIMQATMVWIDMLLDKYDLRQYATLFAQVHDELDVRVKRKALQVIAFLYQHCMRNVVDLGLPIDCDVEIGINWGDLVDLDAFEAGEQLTETAELIEKIRQEESPFLDYPSVNIGAPPRLADIPQDQWAPYLQAAYDMRIPIEDPELPLRNPRDPEGYVIWAAKNMDKQERTYWSGILCFRDGYLHLRADEPGLIEDGFIRVYGYMGDWSFKVKGRGITDSQNPILQAIRQGRVVDMTAGAGDVVQVRGDIIHALISNQHKDEPGGWR